MKRATLHQQREFIHEFNRHMDEFIEYQKYFIQATNQVITTRELPEGLDFKALGEEQFVYFLHKAFTEAQQSFEAMMATREIITGKRPNEGK